MQLSYYLKKIPYTIAWFLSKKSDLVFYCASLSDYFIFQNLIPHFSNSTILSKDNKTKSSLESLGVKSVIKAYPKVLVMARHDFYRFPCSKIKFIGMRHGPYHFKKMINPAKYNRFEKFLFTSADEVEVAKKLQIRNAENGGYPKIDCFQDKELLLRAKNIRKALAKPCLFFCATWDKSGMSAIHKWIDNIETLSDEYEIFISIHPKMSQIFKDKVDNLNNVNIVSAEDSMLYMLVTDILIGDTSSMIGEYLYLLKPIITFKVEKSNRLTPKIQLMLKEISSQIDDFSELSPAIHDLLEDKNRELKRQKYYRTLMFDNAINHTKRAKLIIQKTLYSC